MIDESYGLFVGNPRGGFKEWFAAELRGNPEYSKKSAVFRLRFVMLIFSCPPKTRRTNRTFRK